MDYNDPMAINGPATGRNIKILAMSPRTYVPPDTLCHEVSHALLGHVGDTSLSTEEKELEAETASWIVCRNLGLETRSASFGYLAVWAPSKDRDAKLEHAAHRACEVAKVILEGVEQIAVLAGQG